MEAPAILALAKAVSSMNLYGPGHAARERAVDAAAELLGRSPAHREPGGPGDRVTFLAGDVIVNGRALPEFRNWSWGRTLEAAGIQRIEVIGDVTRESVRLSLERLHARLADPESAAPEGEPGGERGALRFGAVGVGEARAGYAHSQLASHPGYTLAEEVAAIRWVLGELEEDRLLDLAEVDLVVRSLMATMYGGDRFLLPLIQMRDFDERMTTHSMNVAVLSMGLAEFIGLESGEVRGIGVAGILHDIGKTRISREILLKPEPLDAAEQAELERHPVEGARLLLESDERLDTAALVAYEHHVWFNLAGGYPTFRFERSCHPASSLVHVCNVYDVLATDAPGLQRWDQPRILRHIEEASGTELDPAFVSPFLRMMERWAEVGVELESATAPVPLSLEP